MSHKSLRAEIEGLKGEQMEGISTKFGIPTHFKIMRDELISKNQALALLDKHGKELAEFASDDRNSREDVVNKIQSSFLVIKDLSKSNKE